jgi:hypothetical protein
VISSNEEDEPVAPADEPGDLQAAAHLGALECTTASIAAIVKRLKEKEPESHVYFQQSRSGTPFEDHLANYAAAQRRAEE